MNSIFSSPLRYTQGINATELLGHELTVLGVKGHVLIVSSGSPRRALENVWKQTLGGAGISYSIHNFSGECTNAEVEQIVVAARVAKAAVIMGAGGGKVLDAARGAAADLDIPFVSCPTVASTDSPCCAITVIYSKDGVMESVRKHARNPILVLVDTQVIANAPVRTLIAGMGDALSTVFEARACVAAKKPNTRGGACTMSAMALAELCYKTILTDGVQALTSARAQQVSPALDRVIEANTLLSGLGFESAGLAAAHAVHNGLTVVPGSHAFMHGEKVAFGTIVQLMLEKAGDEVVREVLEFCKAVGLPITLAEIGCANLSDQLLAKVAQRATIAQEVIHNEPFIVTADMVARAIRQADAAGQALNAASQA